MSSLGDVMNFKIDRSGLVAVALGAIVLAACDSVKDVRSEPSTAVPAPTAVLQGNVTGLGYRRPVVLEDRGSMRCIDNSNPASPQPVFCRESFFGNFDNPESTFSFGAVEVGTPYDIVVRTQPYGKQCSVAGGQGVVGQGGVNIAVTCVRDEAVPRHAVSGTVAPEVASLPGAVVTLTTEDGVRRMPLAGLSSFTFEDAVFDSASSLPIFIYTVTATFEEGGKVNNCAVTNGTNDAGDNTAAPTADVTNVAITACRFAVGGAVAYNAAPGGATAPMGDGGVTLALRDRNGTDVRTVQVEAFGNYTFAEPLTSNVDAYYELVVTGHPEGQHCVVGRLFNSNPAFIPGQWSVAVGPEPPAVLLIDPAIANWWVLTGRNVYCRAIPALQDQLTGTYQQATVTAAATTTNRNFITFFDNGTFLYGIHMPDVFVQGTGFVSVNGVEHGFYAYDSAAQTISFTPIADTAASRGAADLTDLPGAIVTGTGTMAAPRVSSPTATQVVRTAGTPARIEMTFGASTATPVNWLLTEPASVPGSMTGAWVRPDHRGVWVYDYTSTFGFYAGVNGIPSMSDACYVLNDGTDDPSGYYTRRGGRFASNAANSDCMTSLPVGPYPEYNTAWLSSLPLAFNGMLPGSHHLEARSPSEINYVVTPGSPDTLTVQETLNGTPSAPAVTFLRNVTN